MGRPGNPNGIISSDGPRSICRVCSWLDGVQSNSPHSLLRSGRIPPDSTDLHEWLSRGPVFLNYPTLSRCAFWCETGSEKAMSEPDRRLAYIAIVVGLTTLERHITDLAPKS